MSDIFNRFPRQRAVYVRFAGMEISSRQAALAAEALITPRRIWLDFGITPDKCETLASHMHDMRALTKYINDPRYDPHEVSQILKSWALPLVIASEIPLEEMGWEDRLIWRNHAAQLAYGNCTLTDNFRKMHEIYDYAGELYEDEGVLASDIDFIVTAMKAQAYKADYQNLTEKFDDLVTLCNAALLTGEGRRIWNALVLPDRLAKPQNYSSLQL